jgi:HAD superfamily hydrolase (TIGR01549 family)
MEISRFQAVIFDMDGTITRPIIDFESIRKELGILSGDLLNEINKLTETEQKKAWAVIERHEDRALQKLELQSGARELLEKCARHNIKIGVVTRNLRRSVDYLCRQHNIRFDAVVTREFPLVKPHPGPVLHMLEQWGIPPAKALMVGDYIHDIECGRTAGAQTCFFQNPGKPSYEKDADFIACSMAELAGIIFSV